MQQFSNTRRMEILLSRLTGNREVAFRFRETLGNFSASPNADSNTSQYISWRITSLCRWRFKIRLNTPRQALLAGVEPACCQGNGIRDSSRLDYTQHAGLQGTDPSLPSSLVIFTGELKHPKTHPFPYSLPPHQVQPTTRRFLQPRPAAGQRSVWPCVSPHTQKKGFSEGFSKGPSPRGSKHQARYAGNKEPHRGCAAPRAAEASL